MNRNTALWTGLLGPPIVWLCSFEARFALVPWACTFQSKLALFSVAIAALALCAWCASLSWKQWKALGEHGPNSEAGPIPRGTFMAVGGIMLSAGCALIVVAQTIPEVILGACQ